MATGFYLTSMESYNYWLPEFINNHTQELTPLHINELGGIAISPRLNELYTMYGEYIAEDGTIIQVKQTHVWYYVAENNRYIHNMSDMEFTKIEK